MAVTDNEHDNGPAEHAASLDVSRRAFLKTVSASSVAAGVLAPVLGDAQTGGPAPVGPGEIPVELSIDGKRHTLKVEPRVTLLDAMRTRLNITG